MEIAPIFKPEFLGDLLAILVETHRVKFSVSGNRISEEAIKIGELEGIKLKDRYVGGAPVYLEGKASVEKILEIYKRQYEYFMLTTFEAKKRYDEVEPPKLASMKLNGINGEMRKAEDTA